MSRLTVWLLQTGEPLSIDADNIRPMRAMNLANALTAAGHRVVIWSSAFSHRSKSHRTHNYKQIVVSDDLEIRLIPSPGYKKNIGFQRLWDHAILARNLKKMLLKEQNVPDVAFVGYPPIETSAVMVEWLSKRSVPTLLDVKDQWPSMFLDPLPHFLKPLGWMATTPYIYLAHKSMKVATGMSAMAGSFLQWALDYVGRTRSQYDQVFPLTSPQSTCSESDLKSARIWWDERGIKEDSHKMRVMFVGSHMAVFDFEPLRIAAEEFQKQNKPVEFVICGEGGSSDELRKLLKSAQNVFFPGWIDRPKIETLAERSQAALIPYQNLDAFQRSLPNKVIDSLALGMPILSPLCGEVANLINTYEVGLRYSEDTGKTLIDCIQILMNHPELQQRLSSNAKKRFEEEFTYEKVYGSLVQHLENLSKLRCNHLKTN